MNAARTTPLTDEQWTLITDLFDSAPHARQGRPKRPPREIVDAILWVLVSGEKWRHLPASFPPMQTCYTKYLEWKRSGAMDVALQRVGMVQLCS
jgi:transposase